MLQHGHRCGGDDDPGHKRDDKSPDVRKEREAHNRDRQKRGKIGKHRSNIDNKIESSYLLPVCLPIFWISGFSCSLAGQRGRNTK